MDTNTYTMEWEVGAHVEFSKSILPSLKIAVSYGMYTCQVFMGSPKTFQRQTISSNEIQDCKEYLKRYPLNVFTHFPYVANLNGSVKSLAWNGDTEQDNKTSIMLKNLEYELNTIAKLGIKKSGVVIHPGCYPDRPLGLKTIAQSINKINFDDGAKLLLENCAGEGRKLCKNFQEIGEIYKHLDESQKKHVGVCVDTAHIWGVGDYNLTRLDEVDRMFDDFDKYIGLENWTLLHLNDSLVEIGTKKDRHACLCTGYIWKDDYTSLIYLLNRCKLLQIPMVLETHGSDMLTLNQLQQI